LRIILLYTGSTGFPLGDAYTNRILSLAKGLIAIGCNVVVLIIYPGRKSGVNSRKGVFDSIPYKYMTQVKTSNHFLFKKIIGIWGIFKTMLKFLFQYNKSDVVISFTESSIQNTLIGYILSLKKILFIREANEYPKIVLKKEVVGLSKNERKKIKRSLRFFDGLLCISFTLKDYFKLNHSFNKPILIVPIVVDKDRFCVQENIPPEKYITYCGNIFGEKDGVEILIKAFSKISDKFTEYKLLLIGNTNKDIEFKKLMKLIFDLHLSDRIEFTGHIERENIPAFLSKSSVLTLARPNNTQAKAGFPTKLGEYLATSRPVVVTSVGDIPKYIKDGVNGFLAVPGSVESFAEKLSFILQNYNSASLIGKKGRELVENVFNNNFQAKRIKKFIGNLKKGKK